MAKPGAKPGQRPRWLAHEQSACYAQQQEEKARLGDPDRCLWCGHRKAGHRVIGPILLCPTAQFRGETQQ